MHDIIPGILEKDPAEIEKKLKLIKPFSNTVHIDVIDGKFAETATFQDPDFFKKYTNDFFMEVHLMVEDPVNYIKQYAQAGFKRFLGHIEKMKDIDEFIAEGQILGEVGIAIDSKTGTLNLPLDDLDVILIMGVKAGGSGQEFLPQVLEKIASVRQNHQIPIEVDGGINDKTIVEAKKAGATRFVTTSYIFGAKNPAEAFQNLTLLG